MWMLSRRESQSISRRAFSGPGACARPCEASISCYLELYGYLINEWTVGAEPDSHWQKVLRYGVDLARARYQTGLTALHSGRCD